MTQFENSLVPHYLNAGDVVVFNNSKSLSPVQYVVLAVWLPCDLTEEEKADPSQLSAAIELQSLLEDEDTGYDYEECGEFDLKKVGHMSTDSEDFQTRYKRAQMDNCRIRA